MAQGLIPAVGGWVAAVTLALAVLGAFGSIAGYISRLVERVRALEEKVRALEAQSLKFAAVEDNRARITKLEVKVELFWSVIEQGTSKILHSPHRHESLDPLLDKDRSKLTHSEAVQLVHLLTRLIATEKMTKGEEGAAWMAIAVTRARYMLTDEELSQTETTDA